MFILDEKIFPLQFGSNVRVFSDEKNKRRERSNTETNFKKRTKGYTYKYICRAHKGILESGLCYVCVLGVFCSITKRRQFYWTS